MGYLEQQEFARMRLRADLEQVMARLTGKPLDLLAYEEVRQQLRAESAQRRVLKEIPLDAIVGSVNRTSDFNRHFLPLRDSDVHRWANIKTLAPEGEGLPPIEVYQMGDVYFVQDGHHRVSVARHLGASYIEAYVTEVPTRVPLTPDVDAHAVLVKARYVEFLDRTELDILRPNADLSATSVEAYDTLERHIALHRYMMGVEQGRAVPYAEAVIDWYDNVYSMVVQVIRDTGGMQDFPGYTETDVYLWVSGYRALLDEALNWEFDTAAEGEEKAPAMPRFVGRVLDHLRHAVATDDPGSAVLPGAWRRQQLLSGLTAERGQSFRLFTSLLVPISGQTPGWEALDQALEVARHERGRVLGLHVVAEAAQRDTPDTRALRAEFQRRCQAAGVLGTLAVDVGPVASTICGRSRWVDLTVARMSYPPPSQLWRSLGSGLRTLLAECASPLLLTPGGTLAALARALVAYNSSPRAEEALRVAAYLALHWNVALSVVAIDDTRGASQASLDHARQILDGLPIDATFIPASGPIAETILATASERGAELVVLGGYGRHPFIEAVTGSIVDDVLRQTRIPVLVC